MLNTIALTLLSLLQTASAVCNGFETTRTGIDTGSAFSNTYSVAVNSLACPASSTSSCRFNATSYHINAMTDFRVSYPANLRNVSSDEEARIFELAKQGYYRLSTTNSSDQQDFKAIQGNVNNDAKGTLYEVKPGYNDTLYFVVFHRYVTGILSNCTNATLNNATVSVSAPYLTLDQQNSSVIAGTWGVGHTQIGAATKTSVSMLGLAIATILFTLVI